MLSSQRLWPAWCSFWVGFTAPPMVARRCWVRRGRSLGRPGTLPAARRRQRVGGGGPADPGA